MTRLVPFLLMLAGCVTGPIPPADPDSIAGSWRHGDLTLSISTFSTFAVQRGCVATGGVLRPLGGGRYRIDRYESGFATEQCGPWRSGPEVAPFDGLEVTLTRVGHRLIAGGGNHRVAFRSVSGPIV